MYCARRKRGPGEAERDVPKLGVPELSGTASSPRRGLGMSNGFEGEDIVVVGEQGESDLAHPRASVLSTRALHARLSTHWGIVTGFACRVRRCGCSVSPF